MAGIGRVLVGGSINTDLVVRVKKAPEAGETITGESFAIFGGGKGANQALSVARSGAPTIMLGALGTDDFGRQRLADLHADGVETEHIARVDDLASGVALIIVEESGENRIAYVPGATSSVTADQAERSITAAKPAVLLTTNELALSALTALYRAARAAGITTIFNATPEPATGASLLSLTDVLIVNETEACELLGGDQTDWLAAAIALQRLGPPRVVITLGADGAVAAFGSDRLTVRPPAVTVVDTTGAGDAFCGAFAARVAEGRDDRTALQAGIAAGALAVTVAGAQRSMPARADVESMMTQITVTTV